MNTSTVTCHAVIRFKNCDAGIKEKAIGKIAFQTNVGVTDILPHTAMSLFFLLSRRLRLGQA